MASLSLLGCAGLCSPGFDCLCFSLLDADECGLLRWSSLGCLPRCPVTCSRALMPVFPKTPGDRSRAMRRQSRDPIPAGRVVLPVTSDRRDEYLQEFLAWALAEGLDIYEMMAKHQVYIDDINLVLEIYGRQLYSAGRTYAQFAETLNAITNWKPAIRRTLQGAWPYGFAWVRHEPTEHHAGSSRAKLGFDVGVATLCWRIRIDVGWALAAW